jgi:hypothetical protein
MAGLMARQEITSGRLIIDASADRCNGVIIEQRRQRFGTKLCGFARITQRSPVFGMTDSTHCSAAQ